MSQTKNSWIVMTDGTNIFDSEFRAGALSMAHELGLNHIRLASENAILEILINSKLLKSGNAGIICHVKELSMLKTIKKYKIPCILLGEESAESWRETIGGPVTICSVDNEGIGQMAADYLHEHQRFKTYVYADATAEAHWQWWTRRRYESFVNTLKEHGVQDEVRRISILNTAPDEDSQRFLKQIADLPKPIAIFACNDRVAREVVSFCEIGGLHVPDDVAILGVDDERPICETSPTTISSIKIEHHRLGRTAMTLMQRMLQGGVRRDRTILCPPVRVIERDSTRRLAPDDRFVGRAVEFIRTARPDILNVAAVVAACGASRSYLEKRFKAETGRTILDAIHDRLMRDVRKTLLDTDKPVAIIAQEMGFTTSSGLCSLFKRKFGISMSEFRAQRRLKHATEGDGQ